MYIPWAEQTLQRLLADPARLSHGLLLTGVQGVGKFQFAQRLAQAVLCEGSDPRPCGRCEACVWFEQSNHPDFRLVQPEADAQAAGAEEGGPAEEGAEPATNKRKPGSRSGLQISVKQIRALAEFLGNSTHRRKGRVVLIHPADRLNGAAQNALLKSLEEPAGLTLFLLVTARPRRLLPTVRSRCRVVGLSAPGGAVLDAWMREQGLDAAALAFAGGAPLAAEEMKRNGVLDAAAGFRRGVTATLPPDPIQVARQVQAVGAALAIPWLVRLLYDLSRYSATASIRYHPAEAGALERAAACTDLARLLSAYRELAGLGRWIEHPLNPTLFAEQVALTFCSAFEPRP